MKPQAVYHAPPSSTPPPPSPDICATQLAVSVVELSACAIRARRTSSITAHRVAHVKLGNNKHEDNVQVEQVHGLHRISVARQMACIQRAVCYLMPVSKAHLSLQVHLQMLQLMMKMIA